MSAARTLRAACALALLAALSAFAQDYPARPVKVLVGFPPGGATDIVARIVAGKLQDALGQPFVVENRAGAGGALGAEAVAKSPADGYTLGHLAGGQMTMNPLLYRNLGYDTLRDFAPITMVGSAPLVLAVNAALPAASLQELVALLKAKPDGYAFGTPGNGTPQHLTLAMFMSLTGTKVVHIPYKGATPMLADLISGQVQMGLDNLAMIPHLKAGKLRALAVAQAKRSSVFPDVPTMAEAGLPGIESFTWYGFVAPAGTPAPIVDKLNGEIRKALDLPDVRKRLAELGAEPSPGTPAELRSFIASELAKWGKVVREFGVRVD